MTSSFPSPNHCWLGEEGWSDLFLSPFIADVSVVPVFMQATVYIWLDRRLLTARCYLCTSANRTLTEAFVYSSQMSHLTRRVCHQAKLANCGKFFLPLKLSLSPWLDVQYSDCWNPLLINLQVQLPELCGPGYIQVHIFILTFFCGLWNFVLMHQQLTSLQFQIISHLQSVKSRKKKYCFFFFLKEVKFI